MTFDRRTFIKSGAALGATALGAPAIAQQRAKVKLGYLHTLAVDGQIWTGIDRGTFAKHDVEFEPVQFTTGLELFQAMIGGSIDMLATGAVISNFPARGQGRMFLVNNVEFATAQLWVREDMGVKSFADLKGKRIGVAGGALDKSWLLLRAHAAERFGLDLAEHASPVFGAPPLLAEKLAAGELDAGLLYWNFCARLEAKGFRRLVGAGEIARSFGLTGEIALLGYVFDEAFASDAARLAAFAAASRDAKARLASSDAAWKSLRPLMAAEDEATFEALKRAFLAGIPSRPVAAERADAERLYAVLARIGGEKLVGPAKTLPPGLYWDGPTG
jgi:NitT/TauT family transport system substrate-binding protein